MKVWIRTKYHAHDAVYNFDVICVELTTTKFVYIQENGNYDISKIAPTKIRWELINE